MTIGDYVVKDSSHPLRVFNTAAWETNGNTMPKLLSMIYLHGYNFCLTLLGLGLMGYSGFLVNKNNSEWSKLLMCVSAFCVLTGAFGWLLPNFLSSRLICAPIWWAMNAALCLFTFACAVMSFFPKTFVGEVAKLDLDSLKRPNAGVWLMNHRTEMNVFTILGTCLIACAIGCLAYLYSQFEGRVKDHSMSSARSPAVAGGVRHNNPPSNRDIQMERARF